MRTISIRLDNHTDAILRSFCEHSGLSQTAALKEAIEGLRERSPVSPATLARELGLVGAFDSGLGDLGRNHSIRVKQHLRRRKEDHA